ncbi:hypothetical protein VE01_03050 [Pseudogymnoascus verrucosus]|uniref:Uncharacterized protein n=1 Tax=Pseudogymnoascus verrucosus TaxID=342668 RepID=A0A1B8GR92_9PEZI|nr:uncharacterized protein VE01_03050 [Pseudogymnoascus verrucosus]OBT98341.1 hypothetical protein VE01_03050 [Pseudogymnoascus verrucosus]
MDPMEIDTTAPAAPASPALERSHTFPARPPPPSNRPPLAKRVSFDVPQRFDEPKRHRISPPPPVQLTDTTTSPATPATPTPPTISLLPSIFLPFHGVPTIPSSAPLTREATLVQTIENLTAQKKAAKRVQIHLALQERDRIIAAERGKVRAAAEGGVSEASQDVTAEEMDAIISRLAARPDPKKTSREFEFRGGDWIRDPAEREKWKRPKGEELGRGAAEKVLALTAEAAAKMKAYELQSNLVVEGKKRALENERKRMGALVGTRVEGSGATR